MFTRYKTPAYVNLDFTPDVHARAAAQGLPARRSRPRASSRSRCRSPPPPSRSCRPGRQRLRRRRLRRAARATGHGVGARARVRGRAGLRRAGRASTNGDRPARRGPRPEGAPWPRPGHRPRRATRAYLDALRADAADPPLRAGDAPALPRGRGARHDPPLRRPGGRRRRRLHGARPRATTSPAPTAATATRSRRAPTPRRWSPRCSAARPASAAAARAR